MSNKSDLAAIPDGGLTRDAHDRVDGHELLIVNAQVERGVAAEADAAEQAPSKRVVKRRSDRTAVHRTGIALAQQAKVHGNLEHLARLVPVLARKDLLEAAEKALAQQATRLSHRWVVVERHHVRHVPAIQARYQAEQALNFVVLGEGDLAWQLLHSVLLGKKKKNHEIKSRTAPIHI